VVRTKL